MTTTDKKILVVEDERPMAHALELKLTRAGFKVTLALDGQEAVDTLSKEKYDLILLDIMIPKINGFGVLDFIKEKQIKTPVIMSSNLGQEEDMQKVKNLGAIDYIIKSNTPLVDIVAKIQNLLK